MHLIGNYLRSKGRFVSLGHKVAVNSDEVHSVRLKMSSAPSPLTIYMKISAWCLGVFASSLLESEHRLS